MKSLIKLSITRIHHHIIISGMDRDKAEELWGNGMANTRRMQANELGFEELNDIDGGTYVYLKMRMKN